MTQIEEASPICRGKNLSWETILLFYNNMPREAMPKAQFHAFTESRINGWTQTHSQIARQLAFYYEKDGMCYPRFTREISYAELFTYMQNWAANYFIPNPFAPSLKGHEPTCIYKAVVEAIQSGELDFDTILDGIFGIQLSSHDKVKVYLSNFTNLLFDGSHVSINDRTNAPNTIDIPIDESATDVKKYYDYFSMLDKREYQDNSYKTLQKIYYGAPGTGKSCEVKRQTGELLDGGDEVDLFNVFRTTFHPDTDYASFVGCYKPAMKPTSKEEKTLTGKDEEIVYSFVPQVFTDAYVYAYKNSSVQTYLVIEEINRGNCAQIFGDLFQLLDRKNGESEYKIKADKDLAKYLRDELGGDSEGIKDGKLCLPKNLHILATMNTSDQSLFPMDSAFKRRWEWEYVPINYGTEVRSGKFDITIGKKTYSWVKFIEKVNEKIFALTQSEDKQMGNFFIKQSIDEKGFKSKVMFYLWYEVLRDETENNKYFFFRKTTVEGKEVSSKFTFKDLYGGQSTEILQQFMDYLEVAPK